mmetsp:Transcript_62858/g.124111  ORF Transcript_62858/g.124111 Transcript_62858/m.124111 type:complete len:220 (+) Transcript_62858:118-777(+)
MALCPRRKGLRQAQPGCMGLASGLTAPEPPHTSKSSGSGRHVACDNILLDAHILPRCLRAHLGPCLAREVSPHALLVVEEVAAANKLCFPALGALQDEIGNDTRDASESFTHLSCAVGLGLEILGRGSSGHFPTDNEQGCGIRHELATGLKRGTCGRHHDVELTVCVDAALKDALLVLELAGCKHRLERVGAVPQDENALRAVLAEQIELVLHGIVVPL